MLSSSVILSFKIKLSHTHIHIYTLHVCQILTIHICVRPLVGETLRLLVWSLGGVY